MTHRAGLAGEARTQHRHVDVELAETIGHLQGLGDHHAQHRTGEVDLLVAAVDRDLALARLDPDAGDGVLALAGGVGAALRVDLALVGDGLRRRVRGEALQSLETVSVAHGYWLRTFLELRPLKSMTSGFWASCGCSPLL